MRDRTIVTILAAIIALISARPYAGGWNDGSRLAAVESLVDHHTFAIDDSIFVKVPPDCPPYESGDPANQTGTLDRLYIHGHFYSDKSPVPSVLMAGVYKIAQLAVGLSAHESPRWYCWFMTTISSGLAYVFAVRGMHRIGGAVGLPRRLNLLWVVSFGLGTIALAYCRTVNNHIVLLGIVAALLAEMVEFDASSRRIVLIGALAGFGYTIDLGIGPVLFLGAIIWLAIRAWSPGLRAKSASDACSGSPPPNAARIGGAGRGLSRCVPSIFIFSIAALPWLALHHGLNYAVAGTIGPANANPEYLNWPGSPFNSANMTGHWQHQNLRDFLVYSLELLFGQKGFINHNQALFLALISIPQLLHRRLHQKPELLCDLFWSAGTFAAYAAASNNYSGLCVSVRWFVPLLAPAYFLIALLLRERPELKTDFLILGAFGVFWSLIAWTGGPWQKPPLAWLWVILGAGQACWLGFRIVAWSQVRRSAVNSIQPDHLLPQSDPAIADSPISPVASE